MTTLFNMATADNGRYSVLRGQIMAELQQAPLNETMHRVFRQIVADGD